MTFQENKTTIGLVCGVVCHPYFPYYAFLFMNPALSVGEKPYGIYQ